MKSLFFYKIIYTVRASNYLNNQTTNDLLTQDTIKNNDSTPGPFTQRLTDNNILSDPKSTINGLELEVDVDDSCLPINFSNSIKCREEKKRGDLKFNDDLIFIKTATELFTFIMFYRLDIKNLFNCFLSLKKSQPTISSAKKPVTLIKSNCLDEIIREGLDIIKKSKENISFPGQVPTSCINTEYEKANKKTNVNVITDQLKPSSLEDKIRAGLDLLKTSNEHNNNTVQPTSNSKAEIACCTENINKHTTAHSSSNSIAAIGCCTENINKNTIDHISITAHSSSNSIAEIGSCTENIIKNTTDYISKSAQPISNSSELTTSGAVNIIKKAKLSYILLPQTEINNDDLNNIKNSKETYTMLRHNNSNYMVRLHHTNLVVLNKSKDKPFVTQNKSAPIQEINHPDKNSSNNSRNNQFIADRNDFTRQNEHISGNNGSKISKEIVSGINNTKSKNKEARAGSRNNGSKISKDIVSGIKQSKMKNKETRTGSRNNVCKNPEAKSLKPVKKNSSSLEEITSPANPVKKIKKANGHIAKIIKKTVSEDNTGSKKTKDGFFFTSHKPLNSSEIKIKLKNNVIKASIDSNFIVNQNKSTVLEETGSPGNNVCKKSVNNSFITSNDKSASKEQKTSSWSNVSYESKIRYYATHNEKLKIRKYKQFLLWLKCEKNGFYKNKKRIDKNREKIKNYKVEFNCNFFKNNGNIQNYKKLFITIFPKSNLAYKKLFLTILSFLHELIEFYNINLQKNYQHHFVRPPALDHRKHIRYCLDNNSDNQSYFFPAYWFFDWMLYLSTLKGEDTLQDILPDYFKPTSQIPTFLILMFCAMHHDQITNDKINDKEFMEKWVTQFSDLILKNDANIMCFKNFIITIMKCSFKGVLRLPILISCKNISNGAFQQDFNNLYKIVLPFVIYCHDLINTAFKTVNKLPKT